MVAYSFNKRFAEPIASGHPVTGLIKSQTIRADRRRHARPGELLQIYCGMRTKHCRKIIADPVCVSVQTVRMSVSGHGFVHLPRTDRLYTVPRQLDIFARHDGFRHWADLQAFWLAEHPETSDPDAVFEGVLIRWEPAR